MGASVVKVDEFHALVNKDYFVIVADNRFIASPHSLLPSSLARFASSSPAPGFNH